MVQIFFRDSKHIINNEVDSLSFLDAFIMQSIGAIIVCSFEENLSRQLNIISANGFFLISGWDNVFGKHFILRESTLEGTYEIGDGIWSGVYLTRDIDKVRKAFICFAREKNFDEDVLICDED
jgi:hypothetical protein